MNLSSTVSFWLPTEEREREREIKSVFLTMTTWGRLHIKTSTKPIHCQTVTGTTTTKPWLTRTNAVREKKPKQRQQLRKRHRIPSTKSQRKPMESLVVVNWRPWSFSSWDCHVSSKSLMAFVKKTALPREHALTSSTERRLLRIQKLHAQKMALRLFWDTNISWASKSRC